jgi:hypothetical protein
LGRAAEIREMSVDLPAFGKPMRPASAINFNCRRRNALHLLRRLGPARRPIGGGDEARVAPPAASALGDEDALAFFREIRQR